jgi:DNA-binding transcriptional regulator YiaG
MAPEDAVVVSRTRRLVRTGAARVIREDAGLSVRELAAMVGTSAASLSRWENRKTCPRAPAALRLARALDALTRGRLNAA